MTGSLPEGWRRTIEALRQQGGTILVLGAVDVGKTSFCLALSLAAVLRGLRCGVVDADTGQSEIGPPTTVGCGVVEGTPSSLSQLDPLSLFFVGSTSPPGHLTPLVVGVRRMADRLRSEGCDLTVVDLPGFVQGPAARVMVEGVISALRPTVVVAIQARDELAPLLAGARGMDAPRLVTLEPAPMARRRSAEERATRRRLKFADYFGKSTVLDLDLRLCALAGSSPFGGVPLRPNLRRFIERRASAEVLYAEQGGGRIVVITRTPLDGAARARIEEGVNGLDVVAIPAGWLQNRLLGLVDGTGEHLAVGILEQMDLSTLKASVRAPLHSAASIRQVIFGSLCVRADGTELGPSGQAELRLFDNGPREPGTAR